MPNGGFIDITMTGVEGIRQIHRRVATYELQLHDLSEPLNQIGEDVLASNFANFSTEGLEFAGGWEPLAPSTIARKGHETILYETGRLMGSLTSRNAPGNIYNVTPNSLEVGTSVPYATYHQNGTYKMPQRRVVGWSRAMQQLVVRRFAAYVQQMLNRP